MLGLFGFLLDWLITRDWRHVAWLLCVGVPAATLMMLSAWGGSLNRDQLASRYLNQGELELKGADHAWAISGDLDDSPPQSEQVAISRFAEALFRRARELQSSNSKAAFVVGVILGQQGAMAQALSIMQDLAPDDRVGYPPAHAWIANLMLSQMISSSSNLRDSKFKHHVINGVEWQHAPDSLVAEAARFALETNDSEKAIELLAKSAEKQPGFEADLFRVALSGGNQRVAEQTAEKALPRLLKAVQDGSATTAERMFLADMLYYRQEFDAAQAALEEGLKQPDLSDEARRQLSRSLSEFFRLRYLSSLNVSADNWAADIQMLDRAMRADPSNDMIAEEVAKLARIGGDNPPDALVRQLQDYLAKGAATSLTHNWLAEAYLLREDFPNAITHLKSVIARSPEYVRAQNNLAYALALNSPDRLDEALGRAQKAVELAPEQADFHDTLGYILSELNRVNEAIPEFEMAIELSPGRVDLHERLANAYEKLGDRELAAAHRRVIEQLTANSKSTNANQDSTKQP